MTLLKSCLAVYPHLSQVSINEMALEALVDHLANTDISIPDWKSDFCYHGDPERTLDWIFIFNAINFSYWNTPRWHNSVRGRSWGTDDEAFGVMAALAHAMESGVPLNDYNYLKELDIVDLRSIFSAAPNAGELPMLEERLEALHELAMAFQRFGNAIGMMHMCDYSATKLVPFLVGACPSWRDMQMFHGVKLHFHKRAWLCAAMCYERFIDDPSRRLSDWEQIPLFADYRLPQALCALGVLSYDAPLQTSILNQTPIPKDSQTEIEIRVATLAAAKRILDKLEGNVSALQLDAYLWTYAVQKENTIAPHHRTRTHRY